MKHFSERDLAIHAIGEEPADDLRRHLAECAACRMRFDGFRAAIRMIADSERVPRRGESYGREVWQRVRSRLPEERPAADWKSFFVPRRLAFAGVMTLVLAATFLAGRFWRVEQPSPLSATVRERVLVIALSEHLERSQAILIELANSPATGELDVSTEQARAGDLVAANRLYRQTASREGDQAVSAVLEQLERLLLDVAHGPSRLSSDDLSALRSRIDEQGVLFKVRVIGSTLRERGELPGAEALERKRT